MSLRLTTPDTLAECRHSLPKMDERPLTSRFDLDLARSCKETAKKCALAKLKLEHIEATRAVSISQHQQLSTPECPTKGKVTWQSSKSIKNRGYQSSDKHRSDNKTLRRTARERANYLNEAQA